MLGELLQKITQYVRRILPAEHAAEMGAEPDFFAVVDQARLEWDVARTYFDNVTDPDLVDHAIFMLEAAEKKFVYLLKLAKTNGIKSGKAVVSDQGAGYTLNG